MMKTMSKKTKTTETKQPPFVEELLTNGTAILKAKTLDELTEMVNGIPADVKYGAGAAGYNTDEGVFTLRVDII